MTIGNLLVDMIIEGAGDAGINMRRSKYQPEKIIKNGRVTIFFWSDGTKTVVRRTENEQDDVYAAFVHAFAKKMFGSRRAIKNLVDSVEGGEHEAVSASGTSTE